MTLIIKIFSFLLIITTLILLMYGASLYLLLIFLLVAYLFFLFLYRKEIIENKILFFPILLLLLFSFIPSDFSLILSVSIIGLNLPLYFFIIFIYFFINLINEEIKYDIVTKLFLLLILNSVIPLLYNFQYEYIYAITEYFIISFGIYFIFLNNEIEVKYLQKFLNVFSFSAFIVSLLAIAEIIFGVNISRYYNGSFSEHYNYWLESEKNFLLRSTSTIGNSLILSFYLCFALPIVVYLNRVERKIFYKLYLVIISIGIVLTVSKSAIIYMVLFTVLNIFSKTKNRIYSILGLAALVALVINIVQRFPAFDQMVNRFIFSTEDSTFEHRYNSLSNFFQILFESNFLFGEGIAGGYDTLRYQVVNQGILEINTFDNALLDNSYALGIVGITLIIMIYIFLIKKTSRLSYELRTLSLHLLFVFIYFSMFFDTFRYQATWGIFWLTLSMIFSTIHIKIKGSS